MKAERMLRVDQAGEYGASRIYAVDVGHDQLSDRLKGEALISGDSRPVRDDVWEALEALSTGDREIIQLVHWDGFSLAEAAKILGKKPATVRSRYSRARAKLRADLTLHNDS